MQIKTLLGINEIFHGSILKFYGDNDIWQICNIYVESKFIDIKCYNLTSIREIYTTERVYFDTKDGRSFLNAIVIHEQ